MVMSITFIGGIVPWGALLYPFGIQAQLVGTGVQVVSIVTHIILCRKNK